ncbi:hypothetical protein PF010_g18950 [Phytophthora fragariae]|uniref:Uncharacterized protein n=1 Tax=Phytophthora fragariae TaxID=53985 RepID=A0A6A3E6B9_9STRA|nr:hypothetical protein PF009_g23331 [Phytophthora fragariae]KAE8989702.1 hypothetical protein PF011_g18653 [Phytophthora fragariae]KAE9089531.1 hypothetical protein PF010_g18950 [Phytophthora fragariae]KAE9111571.1 hypothetical protein PF006_g20179 [Phytophthora fragariae]KAE9308670.1 hypothetical protein PF008_g20906 [Phytophthora fragariae]
MQTSSAGDKIGMLLVSDSQNDAVVQTSDAGETIGMVLMSVSRRDAVVQTRLRSTGRRRTIRITWDDNYSTSPSSSTLVFTSSNSATPSVPYPLSSASLP